MDDKKDYRPGSRAGEELGIISPLAKAGLTKEDIRNLSSELGLATADMPSSPCLASRICYGLEITTQRLRQVEEAEEFLRQLGFREFRVRHHDNIARIEVRAEEIEKIASEKYRKEIVEKFKSLGFNYTTVDLKGFASGSLNQLLSDEEKSKYEKS